MASRQGFVGTVICLSKSIVVASVALCCCCCFLLMAHKLWMQQPKNNKVNPLGVAALMFGVFFNYYYQMKPEKGKNLIVLFLTRKCEFLRDKWAQYRYCYQLN